MAALDFMLLPFQTVWNKISTFVLSKIVCIPFIKRPYQKLQSPEYYGVTNAIDVRISVASGQELGAWFMRPYTEGNAGSYERWKSMLSSQDLDKSEIDRAKSLGYNENSMNIAQPNFTDGLTAASNGSSLLLTDPDDVVILYLHGNMETRSLGHRIGLYKKLQALGLVVLAPDYRGYADSYGGFAYKTSESSMSRDAAMSYRFLKKHIHPNSKVIIWGHSLGTGVATRLAYELKDQHIRPDAYVLEAPFNKMTDEVGTFLIAKGFKLLIDVNKIIKNSDLEFDSEQYVQSIKEPLFIMHAEDDMIIPFELGKKLHQTAVDNSCTVKFFPLKENLQLGHDNIYMASAFRTMVTDIVNVVKKQKK